MMAKTNPSSTSFHMHLQMILILTIINQDTESDTHPTMMSHMSVSEKMSINRAIVLHYGIDEKPRFLCFVLNIQICFHIENVSIPRGNNVFQGTIL